jgi:hypothetical protein
MILESFFNCISSKQQVYMSFKPEGTTNKPPEARQANVIERYRPTSLLERFGQSASRSEFAKANYLRKEKSLKNRSKTRPMRRQLRFGYHRSDILR